MSAAKRSVSIVASGFIRVNVSLQSSVSVVAGGFVRVNISLQRSVSTSICPFDAR